MSANLSHAAQGFVNCVVVGKDIVPRLSVVNIGRLIDELVIALMLHKAQLSTFVNCDMISKSTVSILSVYT